MAKKGLFMKWIAVFTIVMVLCAGCSEPKVDPEKLSRANEMITVGNYEAGIQELEQLFQISPSDPALKLSLVQAHLKFGNFYMFNDTLAPRIKYPNALKQYREVLKIDATNQDAKENAQQIIDIYKMMGREVPEV